MRVCKVDLHVHSPYSRVEKDVLRRVISSESYTLPEEIYYKAKKRGMDFVTVTDHNSIEGALEIAHLPSVFISEEVTVKFPEDGCSIHVVVLDINEEKHREIQRLKDNVYELVRYLHSENIVHFVAHPFSSVDGKLRKEHWEKMLVLFDIFEVRNGTQKEEDSLLLERILKDLSPEKIEEIANKYSVAPLSQTPWKKSMVAGSDDHSVLYIGKTYTVGEGLSLSAFLNSIREGRCKPEGRGGSYLTIGHSIYATGYKFYKHKAGKNSKIRFFDMILDDEKKGKVLEKIFLSNNRRGLSLFPKNLLVYLFIKKFSKKMSFLSSIAAITEFTRNLPFYTALFPYLFGLSYQNKDRNLTREIKREYLNCQDGVKVAVFFDGKIPDKARGLPEGENIEVLGCGKIRKKKKGFSLNGFTLFPPVMDFSFPFCPEINFSFPPLIELVSYCEKREFDLFHVLTPGPVGVCGILASKILKVPLIGVYHEGLLTPFSPLFSKDNLKNVVWLYLGWFYNQMDRIIVASEKEAEILERKNIPGKKIEIVPLLEGKDFSWSFESLDKIFNDGAVLKSLFKTYKSFY